MAGTVTNAGGGLANLSVARVDVGIGRSSNPATAVALNQAFTPPLSYPIYTVGSTAEIYAYELSRPTPTQPDVPYQLHLVDRSMAAKAAITEIAVWDTNGILIIYESAPAGQELVPAKNVNESRDFYWTSANIDGSATTFSYSVGAVQRAIRGGPAGISPLADDGEAYSGIIASPAPLLSGVTAVGYEDGILYCVDGTELKVIDTVNDTYTAVDPPITLPANVAMISLRTSPNLLYFVTANGIWLYNTTTGVLTQRSTTLAGLDAQDTAAIPVSGFESEGGNAFTFLSNGSIYDIEPHTLIPFGRISPALSATETITAAAAHETSRDQAYIWIKDSSTTNGGLWNLTAPGGAKNAATVWTRARVGAGSDLDVQGMTDDPDRGIYYAIEGNGRLYQLNTTSGSVEGDDTHAMTPRSTRQMLAQSTPVIAQAVNNSIVNQLVPTGAMIDFAGSAAPAGWLICNGQSVSQTDYADLFAVVGASFGTAASGLFRLPDLRRRVTIGAGGTRVSGPANTIGSTGGEESHDMTERELVPHRHTVDEVRTGGSGGNQGGLEHQIIFNGRHVPINTSTAGGSQPFNVMQPSLVVNKIIKT